jgi:uncharacterized protein (DUF58 family)
MATKSTFIQDLQQQSGIGQLEFLARQVVEGFMTGLHRSPYHGFSVEFAEHRIYNKGESTRHIDWKLYAKTDKLFVKRYEEETNLRCQILLDTSGSMHFPEREKFNPNQPNKIQFSVMAAAALMKLLKKQRDTVGLTCFADTIQEHTPSRATQTHHTLLYNLLEHALDRPVANPEQRTEIAQTLDAIAERIHKRSLVVIFTDFFDAHMGSLERLFQALQHFKFNGHEVIVFHTIDGQKELQFDYENRPYEFVDMETGARLKLNPASIKAEVQQQLQQHQEAIKLKCLQYKIDYVQADIHLGFEQILLPFFLKRQKR